MCAKALVFYNDAKKSVRGALVAVIPVALVCVQAGSSIVVTVLSCAAALLGVGGTVYATKNV